MNNSEYCSCPHLRQPSECARERLRDPLQWKCDSCASTDGIWLCITCGHIGCGRRAHLPALGGGHSKHHYHTFQGKSVVTACKTATSNGDNHGTKKSKILKKVFSFASAGDGEKKNSELIENNEKESKEEEIETHCTGHEVCIDIVTKAVHCYACDDYVLSDEKWLAELREELTEIELRRDATMSIISNNTSSSSDHDFEMIDSPNAGTPSQGIITQPPGITGLDNLGNTCYMNSVLQMLSHCSGFRSFFRDFLKAAAPLQLSGDGGQRIMRQTTVRLNETVQKHQPPVELALTEATHALLRVLWSGQWRSIKPRYFVNTIWKHGGLFAARKQQDAQEFLGFYLGRVDDELKPKKAKDSVMMDLFGVDQFQQVQCDVCKTVTKRTEPLLGLVLSLPDEQSNNCKCDDNESDAQKEKTNDANIIDLIDCVKSLRNTGRFTGDDKFDCETCKEKKDASWSVTLRRYPQSLLISLRRTLWTVEKGVHKDSRQVRFPLELDASGILDSDNEKSPDDDFDSCYYNLASVVSHSGSTPFVGHYIAYAKKEDDWFLFNDSSVTKVKEEDVLDAEAFILLYERRKIPAV